jgi:hypothetical protein
MLLGSSRTTISERYDDLRVGQSQRATSPSPLVHTPLKHPEPAIYLFKRPSSLHLSALPPLLACHLPSHSLLANSPAIMSTGINIPAPSRSATLQPGCILSSGSQPHKSYLGLRVAALFIILVGSTFGALLPVLLARRAQQSDTRNVPRAWLK